jgi:tripeptide aminopeptidase
MQYHFTVLDRFVRYVQIDTQADPTSTTSPSSEKQKDLSRLLVAELLAMGISDAHSDQFGYVYATVPSNTDKIVPTICFCAHVDTAPDCSGTDVKPIIHRNYQGQEIVLPDDSSQIIRIAEHPELANQLGHDIVTASGLTLLGSDDKSGVAEIMDAAHYFMTHPEVKHGDIRLLFTTDEEIGRGVDNVDMKKLGATVGYTLDGGNRGTLENETFSADGAIITIHGVASHPGYAKGKMENAVKIASDIVAQLPKKRLTPETTDKKQGFIHPVKIEGGLEKASITFILRAFDEEQLKDKAVVLQGVINKVMKNYPNSTVEVKIFEQYRNMKTVLDTQPEITDYAMEAIRRAGIKPKLGSIRGGTDGSRLSFMGLPCPNLFAGEQGIHSRQEWVSRQDMEKAVEMIVHLCRIWEEKSM